METIAGLLLCCSMGIVHCLFNLLYYQHHLVIAPIDICNTKIILTAKIWIGTDWIKTPIHLYKTPRDDVKGLI